MNKTTFELNGLTCADCALKIEKSVESLEGVHSAELSFATQKLKVVYGQEVGLHALDKRIRKTVKEFEPEVEVNNKDIYQAHTQGTANAVQFKKDASILLAGILLFTAGLLIKGNGMPPLILMLLAWLTSGADVLRKAVSNIVKGRIFDENLLMTTATVGAIATGQYPEAAAVMLFYKIGSILENLAVDHSRRSIAGLMDLRPESASLKTSEGIVKISAQDVKVGDILAVKPGERIPVDCTVVDGTSFIDTSSLTGESLPKTAEPGIQVLGGCINKTGLLTLRAASTLNESAVSRVLELVQDAASKKAPMESFISKFAVYYTPAVMAAALLTAVLPPLATGTMDFNTWLYRAMIFLVVSCPCALVVSIPLTFFAGIGKASSQGILVKGGNYLEALNKADTIVFDKTGTLTEGVFRVSGVEAVGCTGEELLEYAAYAEAGSTHPIARSILAAYGKDIGQDQIKASVETPGKGVEANVGGHVIKAGNLGYAAADAASDMKTGTYQGHSGTSVYISVDNIYMGCIKVTDTLKKDAAEAVKKLRKAGLSRIVMLTGDSREPAEAAAKELNLDETHYGLLPHQKVEWFEKIKKASKGGAIFVGDGINDAPVLAAADIGVSMGGIGSDAAIEASDVVLMTDEPSKLTEAFRIASVTRRIAMENVVFSILVKILVLMLGAAGSASMWEAVFADVGVTLLAVLNTLRIRHSKIE